MVRWKVTKLLDEYEEPDEWDIKKNIMHLIWHIPRSSHLLRAPSKKCIKLLTHNRKML